MKQRLFTTARAAALASLLCTQGPLVLRAKAASVGGFAAFIDKFWQEAWGSEFLLHQSGLLIVENAPGIFGVQVSDGERVVAQGTYYEVLRLEEPQLGGLPELGGTPDLFRIDHAVTAGLLLGSTGSISAVFGVDLTTTYEGPSGRTVIEGFMPFGLADDVGGAVQGAYDLHTQLGGAAPVLAAGDEPPYTLDCYCWEKYANDRAACAWRAVACAAACASAAIAAIVACGFTGPLVPMCTAAVFTAYLLCLAGCLASEQACLTDATNEFLDCVLECADDGVSRQ